MSNENWMTRLLGDARDLALQASRAKLQAQQLQLVAAERHVAELTEQCELLTAQLHEQQRRVLLLEARFTGSIRQLLGDVGVLALRELLDAERVDAVELPSAPERALLDRLLAE